MTDRSPLDAIIAMERSLLAICLADPVALRVTTRDIASSDIIDPRHRTIYEVASALVRGDLPTDVIALSQELDRRGMLASAGGTEYLAVIAGDPGADPRRRVHLTKMLSDSAAKRLMEASLRKTVGSLADPDIDLDELSGSIRRLLAEAEEKRSSAELPHISVFAKEVLDELESGVSPGTPTGIGPLDEVIGGGIKPTQLVVVAGATGSGKTSLATQIGLFVSQWATHRPSERGPVLIFSYEMAGKELMVRLISQATGEIAHGYRAPHGYIGRDREIAVAKINEISRLPLHVDESPKPNVEYIWGAVERSIDRYGTPSLVIVDHIGLLTAPGVKGNRTEQVGVITRTLKLMAMSLHVPVLALSQLSREVDRRDDHRPMLSDLRESGSIEQDSNIVIFVYRPSYYIRDPEEKRREEEKGAKAEIIVAKNRSGPTSDVELTWIGPRFFFVVMEDWYNKVGISPDMGSGVDGPSSRPSIEPIPDPDEPMPIPDLHIPVPRIAPGIVRDEAKEMEEIDIDSVFG